MTMAVEHETELASDASHFVIEGVSWRTYELLAQDFGASGQRKRITYDNGRMVIVSPLLKHERWKSLLGDFVKTIARSRGILIVSAGSTTWKHERKGKGLEPDECFYIQNELAMRGRLEVNLAKDPPPDLAIEVDLRPYLMNKLEVYAGLGIPEVWCFDGLALETFALSSPRNYIKVERSAALPFLRPAELKPFLDLLEHKDENALFMELQEWARDLQT